MEFSQIENLYSTLEFEAEHVLQTSQWRTSPRMTLIMIMVHIWTSLPNYYKQLLIYVSLVKVELNPMMPGKAFHRQTSS